MIKPVSVKPLEDYTLLVEFSTGEKKLFDVKPYLSMPYYAPLKDISQFKQAFVNGITVEWRNGSDIAPHELYDDSTPLQ